MTHVKAMILGCQGLVLSESERAFFAHEQPWGFILFGRNVETCAQVRVLVDALRAAVGRHAPVFIDQEGGTVRRLRPPLVADYPAACDIGALYKQDHDAGQEAAWACGRLMAADLLALGINADCAPVLDMLVEEGVGFMASRAYGRDLDQVIALAGAMRRGLEAGGVYAVIKHMPGHGRGLLDSHKSLPRVETSLDVLRESDLKPFQALNDSLMAMTCHVMFEAVDRDQPASTSKRVVEVVIRGEVGFDGLLISDDISMNALEGDIATRARAVVAAEVDIVLHCNGDMAEMKAVAAVTPLLEGAAHVRAERVLAAGLVPDDTDLSALRERFDALMAMGRP